MTIIRFMGTLFRKKFCRCRLLTINCLLVCIVMSLWKYMYTYVRADEMDIYELRQWANDIGNHFYILPSGNIEINKEDIHIISSYYDNRQTKETGSGSHIRVFGYTNRSNLDLHCCVQSKQSQSWLCLNKVQQNFIISTKNNHSLGVTHVQSSNTTLYQFMLTCSGWHDRYFEDKPDKLVLVDSTKGRYTKQSFVGRSQISYFSAMDHDSPDNDFLVCLYFSDMNVKSFDRMDLLEFIELTKILGASHITMYNLPEINITNILPNSIKGISMDYVQLEHFNVKNVFPNILAMNDCLYKSVGKTKHITFLDLNDILVPSRTDTWNSMVESLQLVHNTSEIGSYVFQVFSFYDETTNDTSGYIANSSTGSKHYRNSRVKKGNRLPRSVRYRSRDQFSTKDKIIIAEPLKVEYIISSGTAHMLPGYSDINVPIGYGYVHRFVKGYKNLKDLVVDSSKDKLVPPLLRALHTMGFHI